MQTVAIIPARRGSVRVPGKNWKEFHGKPIIQYSIEAAKRSRLFDAIIVSTDGDEIEQVAKSAGAWVVRRPEDDGTRGTQEVAAEVLMLWAPTSRWACVIYPTCPMLHELDLLYGWQLLQQPGVVYSRAGLDSKTDAGWYYWGPTSAFLTEPDLSRYINGIAVQVIGEDRAIDINTPQDWEKAHQMAAKLWGENGKD